jgi:hypothetical protein
MRKLMENKEFDYKKNLQFIVSNLTGQMILAFIVMEERLKEESGTQRDPYLIGYIDAYKKQAACIYNFFKGYAKIFENDEHRKFFTELLGSLKYYHDEIVMETKEQIISNPHHFKILKDLEIINNEDLDYFLRSSHGLNDLNSND